MKANVCAAGKAFFCFSFLYLRDPNDPLDLRVAHLRKAAGESHVEADLVLLRERGREKKMQTSVRSLNLAKVLLLAKKKKKKKSFLQHEKE